MAIIRTLTKSEFVEMVRGCSDDRYDQLGGYAGWGALYDYLDDLSDDLGEQIEADVIALCCEYAHYATAGDAAAEYEYSADDDDDAALEWLQDRTEVIDYPGGVIIRQF